MIEPDRPESLYDQDLVAWSKSTASAICANRFEQVDWPALAEEIEDIGRSERRALASHLRYFLMHLYSNGNTNQCDDPRVSV